MENNHENIARRILELYSSSEYPTDIDREVKQWLVSGLRDSEKEEVLWDIWNGLEPLPETGNAKALKKVRQELGMEVKRKLALRRTLWLGAAAVVAALLLVPGVLRYIGNVSDAADTFTVVAVGDGEKRHTDLTEAAQVWINSKSELAYHDPAEVELNGEAYFDVKKDEGVRFSVKGGELTATVTGTSFNYRSYNEETVTVITLYTGSLVIESADTTLVLTAGHELVYDRVYRTVDIKAVARSGPEWIREVINFEASSVSDIFRELENIYGVTISDNGFASEGDLIELKFEEGISFDEVMYFMSMISGSFDYEIDGDKVTIYWNIED